MENEPTVAYFCMEYGLESELKLYSGGLGILAGDYLKGARDENLPIIGLGILWKQGYTDQYLGDDDRPYDSYPNYRYDMEDTGVVVPVTIRQREVLVKVWKTTAYGNSDLYLLDTDIEERIADRPENRVGISPRQRSNQLPHRRIHRRKGKTNAKANVYQRLRLAAAETTDSRANPLSRTWIHHRSAR